jgi:isoamylase
MHDLASLRITALASMFVTGWWRAKRMVDVVWIYAPGATEVTLLARPLTSGSGAGTSHVAVAAARDELSGTVVPPPTHGWWRVDDGGGLRDGDLYAWRVDGVGPLLDPSCSAVRLVDGTPWSVHRTDWPKGDKLADQVEQPLVYELHVGGFGRTLSECARQVPYLAELGVQAVELMPVHPFDGSDNYWGYMPLVWGAVHEPYGDGDAAADLAAFCAAAHRYGIAVWIDVVVNHTGEADASLPTRSLRGLANATSYRHRPDGSATNDSGCGNDVNPADPYVRWLVLQALQRYADLGVDGFRFDLASLLLRDGGGLVRNITDWARSVGVRVIAEPWDMAAYQVGSPLWPAEWLQWNDRFRDDVRGFVRAEPGLVPAMIQRISGSDDVFGHVAGARMGGTPSLNFVTAHDGLTMYDLTTVNSDRHRSWDCGEALRPQMIRNYLALLLLADGAAMFVMGDECGRTQGGHDNPYNVDSPVTWFDWGLVDRNAALVADTRSLAALRRSSSRRPTGWFGCSGSDVDASWESRSLAWSTDDLFVMANMWWEPLTFALPDHLRSVSYDIAFASSSGTEWNANAGECHLPARCVVVLRRG